MPGVYRAGADLKSIPSLLVPQRLPACRFGALLFINPDACDNHPLALNPGTADAVGFRVSMNTKRKSRRRFRSNIEDLLNISLGPR